MATVKYGLEWDSAYADWQIELKMYQFPHWHPKGHKLEPWEHFVKAAQILWGPNNPKAQFIWHPWAVDMVINAVKYQEMGLCGPSSCGKSEFMAIWTVLNWLVDPAHTTWFVTSTTIPRAQEKIWKAVATYYLALPPEARGCGKLINSPTPMIATVIGKEVVPGAGIKLVACAASQGREAVNKLQGSKAPQLPGADTIYDTGHARLGLTADELSDLVHAINKAADNLKSNTWFSFIAASNPRTKIDPFAVFAEPKRGFDSINVETSIWETKRRGVCLHFDDMKNPNWVAYRKYIEEVDQGKHRTPDGDLIPYRKPWPIKCGTKVQETMDNGDVLSPEYWRNFRGFWSPVGIQNTIYSDDDIKASGCERRFMDWWLSRPKIRCMGVDSAFSTNGDETVAVIADMGYCVKRRCQIIDIVAVETIQLDASNKELMTDEQVGLGVKALAAKYQVAIPNIGFDSTNSSAANFLATVLGSNDFYRVGHAGAATKTPINDLDPTPADEKYGNRVTELWFFGKELMRNRQLFGVTDEMVTQLAERQYVTGKSGQVSRLTAESKKDMKKRGIHSPDHADAMCIMLDTFRQRHALRTNITKLENSTSSASGQRWLDYCKKTKAPRTAGRLTYRS